MVSLRNAYSSFYSRLSRSAAVIAQAGTAKEEFDAACPSKDQTIDTLENGYQFKYICRRNGYFDNLITTETCSTIRQCASPCAANDACKGGAFLHDVEQCQLLTNGDSITARRTGVFLRRERDPTPQEPPEESDTASCSEIETELRNCRRSENQLQESLRQCQMEKRDCDQERNTCNSNRRKCAEDLAKC